MLLILCFCFAAENQSKNKMKTLIYHCSKLENDNTKSERFIHNCFNVKKQSKKHLVITASIQKTKHKIKNI
jgi:hypothetical protein